MRQLLFALGAFVLIGVFVAGFYFLYIFSPASCTDGVLNQTEEGIDCGGECARLCVAPNVTALWARSVRVAPGVYHAVALVKNPDTRATGDVPYTVSLFDDENILIAQREGTLRLLPGDIAPLFEANVVVGERPPARTFVDIGTGEFTTAERGTSPIRVLSWDFDEEAGRLIASMENQSTLNVGSVTVTALLMNDNELLINASQTVVEGFAPRERVDAVFTWQEPFSESPTRVDIIPRINR